MRDAVAGSVWPIEIGLQSQASPYIFKQNPTIASGDFKRSIVTAAGTIGALTNLDNLPTVSPASSQSVSIILSASETTAAGAGGHINIFGIDQAGAEWADIEIMVDVVAVSLYSAVPAVAAGATGGLPTVDANNAVKVQSGTGSNQISLSSGLVTLAGVTHTGAVIPTVTTTTTATNLTNAPTAGDLTATMKASVTAAVPSAATIQSGLATSAALATVAGYVDTEVAAIKAKTDNLPSTPASTSDIPSAATIRAEIDANSTKLDVPVSSRMATFSYTTPPTAAAVRAEMDSNSTQLASILAQTGTDGVVLSTATLQAIADNVLTRGNANVDGDAERGSLFELIQIGTKSRAVGTTLTIYLTDGVTVFGTRELTLDEDALPVAAIQ